MWLLFSLASLMMLVLSAAQRSHRIVGLFYQTSDAEKAAFYKAVEYVNQRPGLFPRVQLEAVANTVKLANAFDAQKKVCEVLQGGVVGVFGPGDPLVSGHVESICQSKKIPHLQTEWLGPRDAPYVSINLMPHPDVMGEAFAEAVLRLKWKKFTLFYQDSLGLARLEHVLEQTTARGLNVTVRRLVSRNGIDDLDNLDYREILKQSRETQEKHFLIDCDPANISTILRQAREIGMMNMYNHYFFTTLDIETTNLASEFHSSPAAIMGYRMLNRSSNFVKLMTQNWRSTTVMTGGVISASAALVFDSVLIFATGLSKQLNASAVTSLSTSCFDNDSWSLGLDLARRVTQGQTAGLTGPLELRQEENFIQRVGFKLVLIELSEEGFREMGYFEESTRVLNITKGAEQTKQDILKHLLTTNLRVTTILANPLAMLKNDSDKRTGNDRFEGYCMDMLAELAKFHSFNYTIHIVRDRNYGAKQKNGEWNGMVAELMKDEADMAVAPFTISYARERAIDFTLPFMNMGISILFKKPEKTKPGFWAFLDPLKGAIWLYMIAAYFGLSFILFILSRLTPYEWDNPHPCDQDSDLQENTFNLANSLWFAIGSIMMQGSDLAPKATSTRLIGGIWWFFTLIIISSYTANLAAFLTNERMTVSIKSAEDLVNQVPISYGCQNDGSTQSFFKTSQIKTYSKMWANMQSASPSVFVKSSKEGIERVNGGNYAFLMESVQIEYVTEQNCQLTQIGGLLDSKGYGIGVPRDSPLRDILSEGILHLQEKQTMLRLKNFWWKGKCIKDEGEKGDVSSLGMDNVGGVFLVLIVVTLAAVVLAFLEWLYFTCTNKHRQLKGSVWKTFLADFKFAINCFASSERSVPITPDPSVASMLGDGDERSYTLVPGNEDVFSYPKAAEDFRNVYTPDSGSQGAPML